jgi:hypothetical protein
VTLPTIEVLRRATISLRAMARRYTQDNSAEASQDTSTVATEDEPRPKSDSKISSRVLRDLDSTVTSLVRPSSICICKLQTHPLVRKGANV